MKKSIFALAAMLAFGAAQAEYIGNINGNYSGVKSSSTAFATSGGNGLSISAAGNSQTASSSSESSATKYSLGNSFAGSKGGVVTVGGTTSGTTASFAGNLSVGNATGFAAAAGNSKAGSLGSAYFDQHGSAPQGNVSGTGESNAGSYVLAGRNGAGLAGGANTGSYGAVASATQSWLFWGAVKADTANTGATAMNGSLSNQFAIGNAVAGTNVRGVAVSGANSESGVTVSNAIPH